MGDTANTLTIERKRIQPQAIHKRIHRIQYTLTYMTLSKASFSFFVIFLIIYCNFNISFFIVWKSNSEETHIYRSHSSTSPNESWKVRTHTTHTCTNINSFIPFSGFTFASLKQQQQRYQQQQPEEHTSLTKML